MRIIDHDQGQWGCTANWQDALHAARNRLQVCTGAGDLLKRQSLGTQGANDRQQVVDVVVASQTGVDALASLAFVQLKAQTFRAGQRPGTQTRVLPARASPQVQ